MTKLCVGLFGTCGKSTFRQHIFIPHFERCGMKSDIDYFNPQKDDWKPEDAAVEAEHLANDQIILFPVTGETYGTGSLAEVGFSILNAIKLDDRRDIVIAIEPWLDDPLMADAALAKESLRARALVIEHLKKLRYGNLFLMDTGTAKDPRPRNSYLTDMLHLSMVLFQNQEALGSWRRYGDK